MRASVGSVDATAELTVLSPDTLREITVTPSPLALVTFTPQALSAEGKLTDGSTVDLSTQVTWASSESAVLSVGATGQ